jgi:BirA family biotin operon repressor/biotin-[acetyl-CoA-carboxylase] ligase
MSSFAQPSSEVNDVPIPGIHRILFFDSVTSTNEGAKQYAAKDEKEGIVLVAQQQTKGRGRHHRTWISPRGGLYFSVLLRPSFHEYLSLFPLLSAVSIASTLEFYDLHPSIKWPNDVRINGKKIAGILVESSLQGKNVEYVIVGMGINVNQTTQHLPVDTGATSLYRELGRTIDRQELLYHILNEFQQMYAVWQKHQFDDIVNTWKLWTDTLGKQVNIHTASTMMTGTAVDIDKYGRLLLQTQTGEKVISAGDCHYLRHSP